MARLVGHGVSASSCQGRQRWNLGDLVLVQMLPEDPWWPVACDHPVVAGAKAWRADALRKLVPARAWQCVSAGQGAKGHRFYDWAFIRLDPGDPAHSGQHWLMVCRSRTTGELAYYHCWMPHPVPLAVLVKVAGRRWCIEERIKTSKGLCGLDQHQVRRWRSWYR
jgi:SRSO17 transposase